MVCDVIFATPKRWFAFEFFPNEAKTRRFASEQNKHLWDINTNNKRTKHKVEWVMLGKIAKKNLDDYNHLYNIFCAMGPKFNYKDSGKGVFGVMPIEYSLRKLLEKIITNDLMQKKF